MNRNKTVKAIKTSLLTLASIVVLYAGSAGAVDFVKGSGYVHSVLVRDDGKIYFIPKDGQGEPVFQNLDGYGCSGDALTGYVHLNPKLITPSNMAYFFKMLSIAQVTKQEMSFKVYCTVIPPSTESTFWPVLKSIKYLD